MASNDLKWLQITSNDLEWPWITSRAIYGIWRSPVLNVTFMSENKLDQRSNSCTCVPVGRALSAAKRRPRLVKLPYPSNFSRSAIFSGHQPNFLPNEAWSADTKAKFSLLYTLFSVAMHYSYKKNRMQYHKWCILGWTNKKTVKLKTLLYFNWSAWIHKLK